MARRGSIAVGRRLLRVRGRSRILFHGHPKFVKRAVILRIFRRNALLYRLHALKLRAAIEEPALLATMQLKIALGTSPVRVEPVREHRSAIGAARPRYRADHARRARSELIGARAALRWLAILRPFFLFVLFRVAVPAMTILSIHKRLPRSVLADCHSQISDFRACRYGAFHLGLYPTGLLHSTR